MRCRLRQGAPGLVVAAMIALCASACGGSAPAQSASGGSAAPAFVIGALLSLTGGGNVYGPQQLKGARLAVDEIDHAGGIDGAKLKLVTRDDASDPAVGTRAMSALIKGDRAVVVLGPTLSLVAGAADPLADRLQTPVLAVSNTVDGIVGDCAYPCTWIWRDSLAERVAVRANVDAYVNAHHPGRAVTVQTSNDVLGESDVTHAVAALRADGVRVLAQLHSLSTTNATGVVKAALAKHPDVLFIGTTFGSFAADVMRVARANGYRGAILGGNTLNSAVTRRLAGTAGAGALSGAAWWEGNDFPENARFITAYTQAYGEAPDQFAAQAYVGVQIVADALRRAHLGRDDKTLVERRAALQNALGDVAISSVLGPFRFTRAHDVDQIAWILEMDGKGGHRLIDFCNPGCG